MLLVCLCADFCLAADKSIGVFVALADNVHQGIVKVPKMIGDGDNPERNLYWGTAEGLKGVFDKSNEWALKKRTDDPQGPNILRSRVYRHSKTGAILSAKAYRGSAIRNCILDFEAAVRTGAYDLVVFIGHNGLMDFELPAPAKLDKRTKTPDCVVLCCKSEQYFKKRIEDTGGQPILLTTQFMYPGSFILHAVADAWLSGATAAGIRERAGWAYASNQRISRKAGMGVFARLRNEEH